MESSESDLNWIKEQVVKGNYQLKLHAVERASLRGIDPLDNNGI